nr:MAG TPA: zipper dimerization domain transcription factor-like protein [Caudoviricetes sp.]
MLDNQDKAYIKQEIQESESRMESVMDTKIRESESRMIAYFEAAIMPKFDLLADGQKTLLETMAPKSRVEALEDEVAFLKQMLRTIASEVNELKKAQ